MMSSHLYSSLPILLLLCIVPVTQIGLVYHLPTLLDPSKAILRCLGPIIRPLGVVAIEFRSGDEVGERQT